MLAFAAFVPHPLLSIPGVGDAHSDKLAQTLQSFKALGQELYAAKPDVIIAISPHARRVTGAFTINQRPQLTIAFAEYGNLSDALTVVNDIGLGYRIKESVETTIPIVLIEDATLDYGFAVPLFHLFTGLNRDTVRVIPIGTADLTLDDHFNFGTSINGQINATTSRIAVVASGDLSHGANHESVAGFNPKAAVFNQLVRTAVEQSDAQALLSITESQLSAVDQCGLMSLIVLLGAINNRSYQSRVLSYEEVLGVGYLTVKFDFT